MRAAALTVVALAAATPALAQEATSDSISEAAERPSGLRRPATGSFVLPSPAWLEHAAPQRPVTGRQTDRRPPADSVGGFQLNVFAGVQLVGSASGQFGAALSYFKPSTGAVGLELEGGFTRGPSGNVVHGLGSIVLQSGVRSTRIVPYLAVGGGFYRAEVSLREAVREELPNFGIEPNNDTEQGALIGFGLGIRYYLRDGLSFRADYREFRAVTGADVGFLDRLFALRRIGGFLSIDF